MISIAINQNDIMKATARNFRETLLAKEYIALCEIDMRGVLRAREAAGEIIHSGELHMRKISVLDEDYIMCGDRKIKYEPENLKTVGLAYIRNDILFLGHVSWDKTKGQYKVHASFARGVEIINYTPATFEELKNYNEIL